MLAFVTTVRPFELKLMNDLEIFNEGTFCILVLYNYAFTEFVPDVNFRYLLGWVFLGIIGINILVNLVAIGIEIVK